ncbi:D-mannose binding lectin [Nonomuraea fuscirosea]|uniref:D-mannose binding lectin n=1 Tax=Nonomuraea fuscirosea TaxID=1291556 RepID=A0A2T0MPL2_9ACTN|nr:curculin domain-containing protein [Nonomuraea fuscirosea]PRX59962.1 D-mannose binding lectin [Nonomuraea fuscirosea]
MKRFPVYAGALVLALAGPMVTAAVTASAQAATVQERPRTTWLNPGQRLQAGDSVRSSNGEYVLQQQKDGNLVLYRGTKPLWNSQTGDSPGAFAAMQEDGNLVVYRGRTALWASNTGDTPGARLAVQDDGNLVIYDGKSPVWTRQSTISVLKPGFSLKANQYVRSQNGDYQFVMQEDGNLVLYKAGKPLWDTKTGGNPGASAQMQKDGNLVVYLGTRPLWNSETGKNPGARLEVQNDGNVVIYDGRTPLWSTKTGR